MKLTGLSWGLKLIRMNVSSNLLTLTHFLTQLRLYNLLKPVCVEANNAQLHCRKISLKYHGCFNLPAFVKL